MHTGRSKLRLYEWTTAVAPSAAHPLRFPSGDGQVSVHTLLMIALMAGLPGTGKSTLARELAACTSGRVLSKDEIRHAIFLPEEIEYSTRQDDYCLQVMLETARYLLARNPARAIFLDGRPFSRRYQIDNVIAVADSLRQRVAHCRVRVLGGDGAPEACRRSQGRSASGGKSGLPALSGGEGAVRGDYAP